jgi:hypothetical protein
MKHIEDLLGIQLTSDVEADCRLNEERQTSDLSAIDDNLSASCDDYQESSDSVLAAGALRVPALCSYGKLIYVTFEGN